MLLLSDTGIHFPLRFFPCRQVFGEDNVGILTGDAVWNRKAPIMVMTTEILRNML